MSVVDIPESRAEALRLSVKFAVFAIALAALAYFHFDKEDA